MKVTAEEKRYILQRLRHAWSDPDGLKFTDDELWRANKGSLLVAGLVVGVRSRAVSKSLARTFPKLKGGGDL